MAAGDFKDLQDAVIARDYAEGDRTSIKAYINEVWRDVQRSFRWSWSETTAALTTTAGTEALALPTDLLFLGRLRPANLTTPQIIEIEHYPPYDYGSINRFNDTAAASRGAPEKYSRVANNLLLIPVPDKSTYSWTLYYWKSFADLSADADTPAMPLADRVVLVYGALSKLAERDRNLGMAQYWHNLFEGELTAMSVRQEQQTKRVRQAHMPGHYYGRFDRN